MQKNHNSAIINSTVEVKMEKIINFYKEKTTLCNVILLSIIAVICWITFKGHYSNILTDFGRELLFPEAVAKGNVLYKDILCIYFPLAYQLNALAYLIFGATVQTLEFCGLINITLFVLSFYLLSEEFLDKKLCFVLSTTVLVASGFNGTLFNMILPYSTGLTYGMTASIIAILFAIKYIKTGKQSFITLAYLFCGAAFTFKGEFGLLLPVLIYLSIFAKPCNIKQNFINIFSFGIIPAFSLGTLLLQGLTINEIFAAADFMKRFFSTESMIYHIKQTGGLFSPEKISLYLQCIFNLIIFFGISFFLFSKTKGKKLIWASILICAILLNLTKVWIHTCLIPITLFVLLIVKFKSLRKNIPVFILTLSAIALVSRMFWSLILSIYGFYTAPIAVLTLIVLIVEYMPENAKIGIEDLKKFFIFALSSYLIYFLAFDIYQRQTNNTKISTEKGTVYMPQKEAETFNNVIKYILSNTSKEQKILILQEGMTINFLTDRKVDMNMPMIDRLYFEAMDESEIVANLEKSDYDVIFIAEGFGLTRFGKPYLYGSDNAILRYVFENYDLKWQNDFVKKGIANHMYCLIKR